jgi:hypothetical protein
MTFAYTVNFPHPPFGLFYKQFNGIVLFYAVVVIVSSAMPHWIRICAVESS